MQTIHFNEFWYNTTYHSHAFDITKELTEALRPHLEFAGDTSIGYKDRKEVAEIRSNEALYAIAHYHGAVLPAPVVILINGAGGCGKSTFIKNVESYCKAVYSGKVIELSTIDPVRRAVYDLLLDEHVAISTVQKDTAPTIKEIEDKKDDAYRSFLHDVKMAWEKYNNGPNRYIVGWVANYAMNYDLVSARSHIKNAAHSTLNNALFLFVNVREIPSLTNLRTTLLDMGFPVLTALVQGKVNPSSFSNDADRNVMDYNYDIVIHNQRKLRDLKIVADLFASTLLTTLYTSPRAERTDTWDTEM